MKNFIFNMPTHVMFGAGQLAHLHEQKLPGKKALIITSNGQSAKKYRLSCPQPKKNWSLLA